MAAAPSVVPPADSSTTLLYTSNCSVLTCERDCNGNCLLGKRLYGKCDDDDTITVSDYALGQVSTLREAIDYSERHPAPAKYFRLWVELRSKRVVVVRRSACFEAGKIKCFFNLETGEVDVKLVRG
jgi:hypothetical protein